MDKTKKTDAILISLLISWTNIYWESAEAGNIAVIKG